MAAQLLELEGEHIEVVQNTAAGKRGVISDAELDMLLDRRKEVFEGRGAGWKSGAAAKRARDRTAIAADAAEAVAVAVESAATTPGRGDADAGLFEVYDAPVDEGNDVLAHMLGEDVAA